MLDKLQVEKAKVVANFLKAVGSFKKFRKHILPIFEKKLDIANKQYKDWLRKSFEEDEVKKMLAKEKNMTIDEYIDEYIEKHKPLYSEDSPNSFSYFVRTFIRESFDINGIDQAIESLGIRRAVIEFQEVSKIEKEVIKILKQTDKNITLEEKNKKLEEYKVLKAMGEIEGEIFELKETEKLIYFVIEEYRKNPKVFNTNLTETQNNPIDETMLKITQTAGLSDFLYAIPAVTKYGHIDEYDTSKQTYINEEKDIEFTISIPEAFKKNPTLTENHVKLFLFSLHKHCTGDKKRTLIPYKEFFTFKGLEDNKDNRKKLKKEIEELESVEFDYKYKEKGAKEWTKVSKARAISYLDTRPGSGISVAFGTWAEYIPSTFIDINKAVFKYPVTRNSIGATTISFKLRELSSMKKKSVRVRILTDLLDISETVINKHGFSWVKDKLERELERIEEAEKLQWQYRKGIHNSRIDFENDYIDFLYS